MLDQFDNLHDSDRFVVIAVIDYP